MTPKEKAKILIDEFIDMPFDTVTMEAQRNITKKCVISAIDNIALKIAGHHKDAILTDYIEYWQEVKSEVMSFS